MKNTIQVLTNIKQEELDSEEEGQIIKRKKTGNYDNLYTNKDEILELQEKTQSLEQVVGTLRSSITKQQEAFSDLQHKCNDLEKQNNQLQQELTTQQQNGQQLHQSTVQQVADTSALLKNEQDNKLAIHMDQTKNMVDSYMKKTENTIKQLQTELTILQQKEQTHHQLLLSQYRSLEKKIDENKHIYNTHKHDTAISSVGACADIAIRHGHAWGHTHTATTMSPTPKMT